MNYFLTLIFALFFLSTFAQLSIKSGGANAITKYDTTSKIDSQNFVFQQDLKTSSSVFKNEFAVIELYVLRDNSKVRVNISTTEGNLPDFIEVERKSDAPLSVYSVVKTLTDEDIAKLKKDSKFILIDAYPESRQLDSYYRLKYRYDNDVLKLMPGVLLPGQNSTNEGLEGDIFSKDDIDEKMFLLESDTASTEYKEFDLELTAERNSTKVNLVIIGTSIEANSFKKIIIERKGSEPLATFRKVKDISSSDLGKLFLNGSIETVDNYPLSQKLTSYYRIKIIKDDAGNEIEFPEIQLTGLRAH